MKVTLNKSRESLVAKNNQTSNKENPNNPTEMGDATFDSIVLKVLQNNEKRRGVCVDVELLQYSLLT